MAEAPAKLPIYEGEVLAGKYKVARVVGMGGMGAVVECRHVELGQRVALKFLLPETLQDAECVTRFSREAKAAVRLKSEHVARVTDVGKLENGAPYMVMEYLHGKDLAAKLEEHGPYEVSEAINYILQACEGVAEAHSIGIIHRDLKPRNLFMTKRPNGQPLVKVLDFGIAKNISNASNDDTALNKISSLIGSPHYIAPEQMTSSGVIDGRADIWSIGVCMFELLSGHMPFDAPTILELCTQVLDHPARSILEFRRDVPAGLVAIIERCLSKRPEDRYKDVGELATALEPFAPASMRGVAADICATLANPPGDDDSPYMQPPSNNSRLSAPPPAMAPGGLVARGLSNPPPMRSLRITDPNLQKERRTTTIPPVSGDRPDRGTRTLYVFASLALIGAIGYAIWVRAMEQREVAHPPEVPTMPSGAPSASALAPPSATPPASATAPVIEPSAVPSTSASAAPSASAAASAPVDSMTTHVHHRPRPTAEPSDNPYGSPSAAAKEPGSAPTP
jgi:serine/threonine-protein kinase